MLWDGRGEGASVVQTLLGSEYGSRRESPQPEASANASCRTSTSLEDKQGSDLELHLRDLAILNLDYLNLFPAFVPAPKPTPVLTAVRQRETFICPAEL